MGGHPTDVLCRLSWYGLPTQRCRVSTASPRTSAPLTALRPARPAPPPLPACLLPACRGVTACEWLDCGSPGLVAGSLMIPSRGKLLMRLFDLATGRCLRASCCDVPPPNLPMEVGGTGAAVRCNTMQYNARWPAGWGVPAGAVCLPLVPVLVLQLQRPRCPRPHPPSLPPPTRNPLTCSPHPLACSPHLLACALPPCRCNSVIKTSQ